MDKIVVIDYGCILFTAIFGTRNNPKIPLGYTITNMILANLLKIGLEPQDDVIIAVDKGKSWRKMYEESYKANRKDLREKEKDINWEKCFADSDRLLQQLDYATNFHILMNEGLEADDWASMVVRYYKDRPCTLVSFDSDWEMLLSLPNVKLFSPKSKKYKFQPNPYGLLAKKIECEKTDNLINPVLTEKDYEKRNICVNLLQLPDFVESIMKEKLENLNFDKEEHLDAFPFQNSLLPKYNNLYNDKSKIITIEKSLKKKRIKKC